MLRSVVLALFLLSVAAILNLLNNRIVNPTFPRPPDAYALADVTVTQVAFVHPDAVAATCSKLGSRVVAAGCAVGKDLIVLPNPCLRYQLGSYAQLACHELGHVNGWPATHPEK